MTKEKESKDKFKISDFWLFVIIVLCGLAVYGISHYICLEIITSDVTDITKTLWMAHISNSVNILIAVVITTLISFKNNN